jgi:hypothetical protein
MGSLVPPLKCKLCAYQQTHSRKKKKEILQLVCKSDSALPKPNMVPVLRKVPKRWQTLKHCYYQSHIPNSTRQMHLGYIIVEEGSGKNIRGRDPVQLKLELQVYIIILQQQHIHILDKKVRSKGMMNIYLYIGFHLIAVYFNFICPILPYKN